MTNDQSIQDTIQSWESGAEIPLGILFHGGPGFCTAEEWERISILQKAARRIRREREQQKAESAQTHPAMVEEWHFGAADEESF